MPNEKTLELNITHEILQICRKYDPLAFTMGTALNRERYWGFDSSTIAKYPGSWMTCPLQYKRAKRRISSSSGFEYVFDINDNKYRDQHLMLYLLTGRNLRGAYYVLPALYTSAEFRSALPHLLSKTFLLDVARIRPFMVDRNKHRLYLRPHLKIAFLRSQGVEEIAVLSMEEFESLISGRRIGIRISELLENMKTLMENISIESKRPRFLFTIFPELRRQKTKEEFKVMIT